MTLRRKIPVEIQEQVRQRANYLCEHCHTDERWQYVRFTMEHITPLDQEGEDTLDNLALACFHCNRRKSNKQDATDPQTNETVPLFNPRTMAWSEHFVWSSDVLLIVPLTAIGRATIELLQLNRERVIPIRLADFRIDRHPPSGDPIQR